MANLYACSDCGSTDVQFLSLSWIVANTGEPTSDETGGGPSDNWCPECESHPYLCFIDTEAGKCDFHGGDCPAIGKLHGSHAPLPHGEESE